MNIDRAFEIEHGLKIEDDGPFITGGPSSPVGLNLPTLTMYIQNTASGIIIWEKFNTGINDWRIFPASKIGFDSSGVEGTFATVQDAIVDIKLKHFGENYTFNKINNFTTTNASFQTAISITSTAPAGTYRANWRYGTINSKKNTSNQSQVLFGGVELFLRDHSANILDSISSFDSNLVHAGGSLSFQIRLRRSAGNGTSSLNDVKCEIWRLT